VSRNLVELGQKHQRHCDADASGAEDREGMLASRFQEKQM
jgi:hypothetical protein